MEVEQLPDLSDWFYVEVWSLEEAGMLWAAIDPMEHEGKRIKELQGAVSAKQYLKARIYLRAAMEAVGAGTLSFTEAWEHHEDEHGNIWTTQVEFPKLPSPRLIASEMTRVQRAAFIKWAQAKQMPSLRQILKTKKYQPSPAVDPPEVVDVVEEIKVPESRQKPVLLLAKPSPLDTKHPHHAEEVGFAAKVWGIAVELGAPLPGRTVKQTHRHILDSYPEFRNLSNDAKERISKLANWERRGGSPATPTSENLPTPAD